MVRLGKAISSWTGNKRGRRSRNGWRDNFVRIQKVDTPERAGGGQPSISGHEVCRQEEREGTTHRWIYRSPVCAFHSCEEDLQLSQGNSGDNEISASHILDPLHEPGIDMTEDFTEQPLSTDFVLEFERWRVNKCEAQWLKLAISVNIESDID